MSTRRIKVGPVAEAILATIAIAGITTVAVCAPNALQLLKPFFKKKKYSQKRAIQHNIESLIRTGLVTCTKNEQGEQVLALSRRGKWESMLRRKFDTKIQAKWDGQWRIVIFDVPNAKGRLRIELTRGMKLYGFQLLQKSVWIYPYPCDDFVVVLRKHLDVADNVLYLTASWLENDKKYRKAFKV